MQLLREKSRSTLIYFLFAILIIVFMFTFNTSGSGGCGAPSPLATELAEVDGEPIDAGLLNMGVQLTPGSWRPDRPDEFAFLGKDMR